MRGFMLHMGGHARQIANVRMIANSAMFSEKKQ